jgi:quinol monooxygenase YgiN
VIATPGMARGSPPASGKRQGFRSRHEAMVGILKESAADMPGCFSYVVAKDSADEHAIWVTEVWDSIVSHDASLSSPSVKNAIPRAEAIVSSFEKIAVTNPVWGVGLPPAHAH